MARPLIITDCDEVLLHMLVPFRGWLDEVHGIHFSFGTPFEEAFRRKDSRDPVERSIVWSLLGAFFETEMHRQYPIKGAFEAIARLSTVADIVVLTNLEDHRQPARAAQLASHGLHVPVHCNRGGKGPAAARIIAHYRPSVTLFVDDIENNHRSLAEHVPQVWRLHMVGEAELAPHIPTAPTAHTRIDDWVEAERWIVARIADAA
ncbi:HAD family hydrolase [Sphingobium sufflavum]|uniref:HAD family hydrolase n=1 Tax=Sphingobium sufflavum TaxID=1129547 RepID=UPI001F231EC9|nr:HAD family hydrolase [Sphingobium sufflavum]MCE7795517.1 HAD family hydrolase [Sphingobium sufflavum]